MIELKIMHTMPSSCFTRQWHCSSYSFALLVQFCIIDPMDFFPSIDVDVMGEAFEMIFQGQLLSQQQHVNRRTESTVNNDNEHPALQQDGEQQQSDQASQQNIIAPVYMSNGTLESRNQVTRIQFSWYQFEEFPRDILGRCYSNLQHLDIRQNG